MAHELVSPHCSSWRSGHSGGATASQHKFEVASTITVDALECSAVPNERGDGGDAEFYYETVSSPSVAAGAQEEGDPHASEPTLGLPSRASLALLANYFAAGAFHGAVPALVYPLFKIHLGLQGYQANAVQTLLGCAWHGKLGLSLLTDCVPICGRRRTPYLYLGWTFAVLMLALATATHKTSGHHSDEPAYLVVSIMVASVGYLLVDAACDGIMVETAHREHQAQIGAHRGNPRSGVTQSTIYAVRFIAELLGTVVVAVGFNSSEYGGNFSAAMPLDALFLGLATIALVAMGATIWGIREPRMTVTVDVVEERRKAEATGVFTGGTMRTMASSPTVRSQFVGFWRVMQQRATWQIALFGFLQKFCLSLGMDSAPQSLAIHQFWLHTDPLTKNLFLALSSGGVCVAASVFVHRHLLAASWRATVLLALLAGLVVGFPASLAAVFNVCRDKFLFLCAAEIVNFADCVAMVLRMLVVVEIAEPGFESSTYGLVTSVYNLADPVAVALSNVLGAQFRVFDTDIAADSGDVRLRAGALFAVIFGIRVIVSLAALPMLPTQRCEARELKARGGANKCVAIFIFSALGAAFLAASIANFLAILESTACLGFAGGSGC